MHLDLSSLILCTGCKYVLHLLWLLTIFCTSPWKNSRSQWNVSYSTNCRSLLPKSRQKLSLFCAGAYNRPPFYLHLRYSLLAISQVLIKRQRCKFLKEFFCEPDDVNMFFTKSFALLKTLISVVFNVNLNYAFKYINQVLNYIPQLPQVLWF